jgi:hypothetical protein
MDGSFELKVLPTYLHLKYPSGSVIDPESSAETWVAIGKLCEEHGRSKVLIEASKPVRQLDTMSAFESGRILAENTVGLSIAVCFHEYEFDELSSFFKTVARNRGVKIELFTDLDAARHWLDVETGENAAGNH